MTTLTNFFKGCDSQLGIFYPKHYIIATFAAFQLAEQAAQALRNTGASDEQVLAIPGEQVLKYFEEFRAHSGLWAGVMSLLSRGLGTGQVFADDDVEAAYAGAGFLAVHSTTDAETARIQALVVPFEPRTMHWYETGGIHTLI
jgi:hypothetical protein